MSGTVCVTTGSIFFSSMNRLISARSSASGFTAREVPRIPPPIELSLIRSRDEGDDDSAFFHHRVERARVSSPTGSSTTSTSLATSSNFVFV